MIKYIVFFLSYLFLFSVVNALEIKVDGSGNSTHNDWYKFDTSNNPNIIVNIFDRFSSNYSNGERISINQPLVSGSGVLVSELYGDFYIDGDMKFKKATTTNSSCSNISYDLTGNLSSQYWGNLVILANSYFCPTSGEISINLSSDLLGSVNINDTLTGSTFETTDSRGNTVSIGSVNIFDNTGISVNGQLSLNGTTGLESELTDNNIWVNKNVALDGKMLNFNKTINKNLSIHTKGLEPISSTYIDSFTDKVSFFDFQSRSISTASNDLNYGDILTLHNSSNNIVEVDGEKLLYLKGGNLYIKSDIKNMSSNSQLVIIVKRDSTNNNNGGNIYIDPDVTNIDAVLIADGSIISFDGTDTIDATSNSSDLRKQLLIYGSISTKNTFGENKAIYGTDGYISNGGKEKLGVNKYNLANLRSFQVMLNDDVIGDCSGTDKLVAKSSSTGALKEAFAGKKECYFDDSVQNGLRSTEKTSSLVIEYNPIMQIKPHFILKSN